MSSYEEQQAKLLELWKIIDEEGGEILSSASENEDDDINERSDPLDIEEDGEDYDQTVDEEDFEETETRNYGYVGKDGITEWSAKPGNIAVRTRAENIISHLPGVKRGYRHLKQPGECWNIFFTDVMLADIVKFTNAKLKEKASKYTRPDNQHLVKPTTIEELKALIGLLYAAGLVKSGRQNVTDLWGTDGFGVDIFRITMCEKRFTLLLQCLRFDNGKSRDERRKIDKLAPIRAIFDVFVENSLAAYTTSEYVTIDEKLEAFRGRCSFRQFIPNKPAKYGIKIFALVDARTFYVSNQEIYAGQQPPGPFQKSNKPEDIVMRLCEPIRKSGRNVTFDNWFASYNLSIRLLNDFKLTSVCTLRKNKKEIPTQLLQTKNRPEKSTIFAFQENVTMVSYVPKKNKNVLLLSTLHHTDTIDESTGDQRKPEIITFYNLTKGGVDVADELSSNYNVSRNSRRWPLTIFFSLLNTSSINSYVIYSSNVENGFGIRRSFIKQLSLDLILPHLQTRQNNPRISNCLKRKLSEITGNPLTPYKVATEQAGKKQKKSERCRICERSKDRKSFYTCVSCGHFICLEHSVVTCDTCSQGTARI